MKVKTRYLTKSRFKVGHECATKLFYEGDKDYASSKLNDKFLQSLADGGLQIGALAQLYFPGGIEVKEIEHDAAVAKTLEYLQQEQVILFEAAIRHEDFFIRVDILKKNGSFIELIEVKAKSWDKNEDGFFNRDQSALDRSWEPYIGDIAFQTHVSQKAFPSYTFTCSLMLANKNSKATVDGLHQKFFLKKQGERSMVEVDPSLGPTDLGAQLLVEVPTNLEVKFFLEQDFEGRNFEAYARNLAEICKDRKWVKPTLSRDCGQCEFRVDRHDLGRLKSGFEKCWGEAAQFKDSDFERPLIFDIWALDYRKKESFLTEHRYFMDEIEQEDLQPKTKSKKDSGLARSDRQWKQIAIYTKKEKSPFFDAQGLAEKISEWTKPFHFIDFETITSAIPFTKGLSPYETVAFQFSHHEINKEGQITHKSEYISSQQGQFPNFEFLRQLRSALGDTGTVFRYATHENTVLRHIKRQLGNSSESDRQVLMDFIDSLTVEKDSQGRIARRGSRCMVDMLELVKNHYLSEKMGGSNSIKAVLPAVMSESEFLQNKYSKPIYGRNCHKNSEIKSHNFDQKIWFQRIDGKIQDPYQSLEPIFNDVDPSFLTLIDRITDMDEIREGGSASTAYARMQFTKMSDEERTYIAKALLKYCELDTLAMVMIYEYWMELLNKYVD
jgi:hypothetical protein